MKRKLKNTKKFFITLDGPMGSGKTTVANLLFHKLKRTAVLSFDSQKWSISDFGFDRKKDYEMITKVRKSIATQYIKHDSSKLSPIQITNKILKDIKNI